MSEGVDHLVVTVHGIRTYGDWQARLESIVHAADNNISFYNYTYGYFSSLAFLFPPTRWIVRRRFRRELIALMSRLKPRRTDLVGHSFGTNIIGKSLRKLPSSLRFHTIILAGSVLKSDFYWPEYLSSRVGRVINDCGTKDLPLIFGSAVALAMGQAGRTGFIGMNGPQLRNRYSPFGHSGYFQNAHGENSDVYMEEKWLPLLIGDSPVDAFDKRAAPSVISGFQIFLTNNFELLKISAYLAPFVAALIWVTALYIQADAARNRMEAVVNLADAYLIDPEKGVSGASETKSVVRTVRDALNIPFRRSSILWIDDQPQQNEFEQRAMDKFGLCFTKVRSTEEAIRVLKADPSRYSLILSDFKRNGVLAGLTLADDLKATGRKYPIIFYASDFTSEQAEAARKAGTPEVRSPFELYAETYAVLGARQAPVGRIELIGQFFTGCRNAT